ncbi:MAG: hypothetical protein N3G75_08380 [Methanothrix sp.]|nr:hypothetical protein [Methanothrix sp.]MCX8207829.1 hypothetical protein [Methanothrix sp.]
MSSNYLTRKKTLMGIRYEEEVKLDQYGGAVVRVHAISDVTLARIESRVGYSLEEALSEIASMNLSENVISDIQAGKASPETTAKFTRTFDPRFKLFLAEVCKAGIIPNPDCGCKGKGCEDCDVSAMVEELRGYSLLQIGMAIIGASTAKWSDVEDFFSARKAQSGAE